MWLPDVITSTPAPKRASAVDTVKPMPPAMFSPFAVTKSSPRSSRSPGRTCSTASRPGLPMMSPIIRIRQAPGGLGASPLGGLPMPALSRGFGPVTGGRPLLRVLDGARLANHRHLDLAWIGQAVLDLLDDVAGESGRGGVVDLFGTNEDPHLATRLDRERPLDPREALGDALEILEALDVRLHRLAAS